ncbi:MAG: hypothetical protein ACYDD4_04340 [Acidimicrobiales bacterium]
MGTRGRWWSGRAIAAHVALVLWVPGCALAAWWQVGIALGGDSLGWVYSVMWPCFAVFGIVFWWFLVHDDPETHGARALRAVRQADPPAPVDDGAIARDEEADPELAEYNAYLTSISERPKSWRRG